MASQLRRARQPGSGRRFSARIQRIADPARAGQQRLGGQDREDHGTHRQAERLGADGTEREAGRREHEAELAALADERARACSSRGASPPKSPSAAIGMAFPSVMMSSSASTTGHAARTASGWSSTPMETKKNVLNSSRSGTISPSTLALRSDSASAIPATKAPSAMLTPSWSAANAVPMATPPRR